MEKREIKEKIWLFAHSTEPEDRREWAVLYWKSKGLKHQEIAEMWHYSLEWVQRYMTNTYERFGIPKELNKYEKFERLKQEVLPVLNEFLEQEPETLKELPPPPVGLPKDLVPIEDPLLSDNPEEPGNSKSPGGSTVNSDQQAITNPEVVEGEVVSDGQRGASTRSGTCGVISCLLVFSFR